MADVLEEAAGEGGIGNEKNANLLVEALSFPDERSQGSGPRPAPALEGNGEYCSLQRGI